MEACEAYEEMISAWVDGLLPEGDREKLMAHLAVCPACQACFDDQLAIHAAMDRAPVSAPEGFARSLMARVSETPQRRARVRHLPRWRQWAALAACCALAALGLWSLQSRESNRAADQAEALSLDDAGAAAGGAVRDAGPEARTETTEADPADAPAGLDVDAPEEKEDGLAQAASQDTAEVENAALPAPAAAPEIPGATDRELFDYETASALFGPELAACTEEDFLGYSLEGGDRSGPEETEGGCAAVTYVFSRGTITVERQDRQDKAQYAGAADSPSVRLGDAEFFLEEAPEGQLLVRYRPDGEAGFVYTAQFDAGVGQEAVFGLLLSIS